ncbi:MAG: ester cyclase [Ferruginibacter sp.]
MQQNQNKEFILNYFNAVSIGPKTREFLKKYMSDEPLIGHIEFFENAFPNYQIHADEMTAEGNRVVVKAHLEGTHLGNLDGISATFKKVNFPFVVAYEIENNMIISHWMIADQMTLMEQLGVIPDAEEPLTNPL